MSLLPKVLVIAHSDVGGSLCYLAQEMRRREKADVRVLTLNQDSFAHDSHDLNELYDGGQEIESLVDACDVLHFVDLPPLEVEISKRPLVEKKNCKFVVQIDGRNLEHDVLATAKLAQERGWELLSTKPGFSLKTGAHFLPPFIPWWRGPWRPLLPGTRSLESIRRPGVVFTSSRVAIDRRPELEALLDRAEDFAAIRNHKLGRDAPAIYMESVVRKAHRQVLQRRRFAHLSLAVAHDGLALSALESLAQGVRVITDLNQEEAQLYREHAQGENVPVIACGALEQTIEHLSPREDGDPRLSDWARRCLDPTRWFEHCERLWSC